MRQVSQPMTEQHTIDHTLTTFEWPCKQVGFRRADPEPHFGPALRARPGRRTGSDRRDESTMWGGLETEALAGGSFPCPV